MTDWVLNEYDDPWQSTNQGADSQLPKHEAISLIRFIHKTWLSEHLDTQIGSSGSFAFVGEQTDTQQDYRETWNLNEWFKYPPGQLDRTHHEPPKILSFNEYVELFESRFGNDAIVSPMIDRIKDLQSFALEEQEQSPVNCHSLLGLFNFIDRFHPSTIPEIGLTYQGFLHVKWSRHKDLMISVDFLDISNIKFVAFFPSTNVPGHIERISGFSTINSVRESIKYSTFELVGAKTVG